MKQQYLIRLRPAGDPPEAFTRTRTITLDDTPEAMSAFVQQLQNRIQDRPEGRPDIDVEIIPQGDPIP